LKLFSNVLVLVPTVLAMACSRGAGAPSPAASPAVVPSAPSASVPSSSPDAVKPLPDPLPDVIARVNGQPIPLRFAKIMADDAIKGRESTKELQARALRSALDQLVTRELLFQEALAQGVSADSAAVDRKYDEVHAGEKDEEAWKKFLAQQGLTPQTFKTELRTRQTVTALLDKVVAARVPQAITDQEAKAFYDGNPTLFNLGRRVRASHILVLVPKGTDEKGKAAFRAKAEAALKRVRDGEDFGAVARAVSQDEGSAVRGGELPVFGKGEMVPPFEAAAFALGAGKVSDLVETQFGFHVIKVHEQLPDGKAPFDSLKESLKKHLLGLKRQEAMTVYVNGLRDKAKIEIFI
jgi:peptidyl-prolyl cis-trans isomerase C